MIERPKGFLDPNNLDPEVFDYVRELHEYLWQFVSVASPGASGSLRDHIDGALERLQPIKQFAAAVVPPAERG